MATYPYPTKGWLKYATLGNLKILFQFVIFLNTVFSHTFHFNMVHKVVKQISKARNILFDLLFCIQTDQNSYSNDP